MWCMSLSPSLRAKRSNPFFLSLRGGMDCFASLAMTARLKSKSQLRGLRPKPFCQLCPVEQLRRWPVIAEHDERKRLPGRNVQPGEIRRADRGHAARGDDAIDRLGAEA